MAFVKIDTDLVFKDILVIPRRHRMAALGVFVTMICWSYERLTDGVVPEEVCATFGTRSTLESLADAGLIEVESHAESRSYRIPSYGKWYKSAEEVRRLRQVRQEAGRKGGLAKSQQDAKQSAKQCASAVLKPEIEIENKRTCATSEEDRAAFARWWQSYPRKKDKSRCATKYHALLRRYDADEIDRVTRSYLATVDDPRYIRYPATFLNNFDDTRDELEGDDSWLERL